ncbi:MAG: glycosyltransferase family 2 protein [Planctomycetaceae bacterium]|nr:glycosyltransferase family 2 protein [Planctomycetaceae bacterium]
MGELLKTTVCVPCYGPHFQHIEELIDAYEKQTVPPDELVISLSESRLCSVPEKYDTVFPVKVICSEERRFPGENRNVAAEHSSGDILIFNDADDLPCRGRVEIIRHVFATRPNAWGVVHDWVGSIDAAEFFEQSNTITVEKFSVRPWVKGQGGYANGPVSIRRSVIDHVRWSRMRRAEDVEFFRQLYYFCRASEKYIAYIVDPIYLYRKSLSSERRAES